MTFIQEQTNPVSAVKLPGAFNGYVTKEPPPKLQAVGLSKIFGPLKVLTDVNCNGMVVAGTTATGQVSGTVTPGGVGTVPWG